jgi:quinol monooxygenase YgiN
MTIGVLATLNVDVVAAGPVRAALLKLAEHAATEPGTELFEVHEVVEQTGHFVVFERYRSEAAMLAHRTSPAMDDFRTALRRADVRPAIVFLTPLPPSSPNPTD